MMNSARCGLFFGLSLLLVCNLGVAAELLWLSDDPPKEGRRMRSSHGGPVEVRKGVYYKHLWLRRGGLPMEASYVSPTGDAPKLVLVDTEGKVSEEPFRGKGESDLLSASFPMPEEGFYNAYLVQERVEDSVREVTVAKKEALKHSCREGHDDVRDKIPPRHNREIPLEIVRERWPKEDFHARLGYGDEISFLVLRDGAPLEGAQVLLTSGQGWSRSGVSDAEGRVSYTMIRDYFPPWELFEKRHAQPYLISATYSLPESGQLGEEPYSHTRYQASFSGNYYPSKSDYTSYAYGLSYGGFALMTTGFGIYFYRRRRNRPYREVRFHE